MKMTKLISLLLSLVLLTGMACAEAAPVTEIVLSDDGISVNGEAAPADPAAAVYTANDIIYYESGRDFTYGDGRDADAHDPETAAAHTVVHIAQPGTYSLSGKLSRGQIAVDLGADTKDDPSAVVTLILNNAEISCEVAPAIIFYNVYECGSRDEKNAARDVDTSAAGANIILADGSENTVAGSYVADIYDPETLVLSEDGAEVEDAEKLHSYDGALYSRMSINISGEGSLTIDAENEGLCSELHLTVNGGRMDIFSGNDGINANEDNLSVVTVNGGTMLIRVTGETGEGDGIDSNGWIVINDGTVIAAACGSSMDAGIDSDMGIHINGGTVAASGNMLDHISDGGQTYAAFSFAEKQSGGSLFCIKGESGEEFGVYPANDYSVLVYSDPDLAEGTYSLWSGDTQLSGSAGMSMGGPGMMPGGMEMPDDMPEFDFSQMPEGMPEFDRMPDFENMPQPPEGMAGFGIQEMPGGRGFGKGSENPAELSAEFEIKSGANNFGSVSSAK